MKVLFVLSSMQGGGAERVAALLSSAWAMAGHQVELMPTFSQRSGCSFPLHDNVRLTFLFDVVGGSPSRTTRIRALRRHIKSHRPDVIISFLTHVNCAAIIASMGLGIPVIASERAYPPLVHPPLARSYRILRRLTYPFAAALVGQTTRVSEWLRARAGRVPVATIPNPIVLPLPANPPSVAPDRLVAAGRKVILWAGRFEEQKRPDVMVDAFANVAANAADWDLVMLGEGSLHAAIVERSAKAGLSERIFLPGFAGNLADWYGRADLYVMSSSFEGFPNSLLEAMAYGVPSIAFDVPTGPRELSEGERLMLLPDRDQTNGLQKAIEHLIADAQCRRELGKRGQAVREEFSLERILSLWDSLLGQVVPSGHATKTEF